MKKGFKDSGAKDVKVVNVPTVKIDRSDDEPEKMKPSLHLDSGDFSKVADWEVGKEYKLALSVKMTGKNMRNYKGDGSTCGDFDIQKVEVA